MWPCRAAAVPGVWHNDETLLITQGCWVRPGTRPQEVNWYNWYNSNGGIMSTISQPSTLLFHLLCSLYFVLSTQLSLQKINQSLTKKTLLGLRIIILYVFSKEKKTKENLCKEAKVSDGELTRLSSRVRNFPIYEKMKGPVQNLGWVA